MTCWWWEEENHGISWHYGGMMAVWWDIVWWHKMYIYGMVSARYMAGGWWFETCVLTLHFPSLDFSILVDFHTLLMGGPSTHPWTIMDDLQCCKGPVFAEDTWTVVLLMISSSVRISSILNLEWSVRVWVSNGWIDSSKSIPYSPNLDGLIPMFRYFQQKRCDSWAVQAAPLAIFIIYSGCTQGSGGSRVWVAIVASGRDIRWHCQTRRGMSERCGSHILSHNITYILIYSNTFKLYRFHPRRQIQRCMWLSCGPLAPLQTAAAVGLRITDGHGRLAPSRLQVIDFCLFQPKLPRRGGGVSLATDQKLHQNIGLSPILCLARVPCFQNRGRLMHRIVG